jgi:acetyl esterase/lipase
MPRFNDLLYAQTPQRELRLDVVIPEPSEAGDQAPPLVVFIPMAGMRACAKERAAYWLTEHGFAMASIEARVSHEAPAPAAVHDCKAAIRWLRARAADYGYDPNSIGVWGHSAGGLLASLLATSGDGSPVEGDGGTPGVSSRVQAACDECGVPHDLMWFARPEIKSRFAPVAENLRLYLGGPVEEKGDLARLVSPSTYISSACSPILLFHGDADQIVPVEESVEFHTSLKAAGVDATLCVLPGTGHGWDQSLTRDRILEFFTRTLKNR